MELKYLLENLIFASGEPLPIKKIAQILEKEEGEVNTALTELKTELNNRGLRLTEKDGKIQMTTAPEAGKYIEKFVSSQLKEDLSDAALETLAAVSYLGPITKQELEDLRGVNCSFTLRNLLIRGLIEKTESQQGRSTSYKTSFDFLKKLGVESESDLPDYGKYREEVKSMMSKNQKQDEEQSKKEVADQ